MRRSSPLLLVFVCLFLAAPAWAAPACPALQPVYISSMTQILCVETAPGATQGQITVLLTDNSSNFGDIAFGPDGRLYFTDSIGMRVVRFDLVSASSETVANIPGTPNGLAFSSSNGLNNGDLYVNSSTGVWLIGGIACVGCAPSLPITPTHAITFSAPKAGGNAFDVFSKGENETQVIVDQTNGQILQSSFSSQFGGFNSATFLANVPSLGQGIFANFCGDTLVASGTTLRRLSFSFDNKGNLVVTQSTYANFLQNNVVQYFEVAADNTVLATTFVNGAGGIVWMVKPFTDGSGEPSCSAAPAITQLASLKAALQAKTPSNLVSNVANGVALGPTSIKITKSFDPANQSQIYNFGPTQLIVNFEQVLQPFTQSFTAVRSRPADISFSTPPFQLNTVPIHVAPLGGFAVQFVTPAGTFPQNCSQNSGNPQYGPCPPDNSAIQLKSSYSTQDFLNEPGTAGAEGDTLLTMPNALVNYTDDPTHDLWFADTTSGTGQKQFSSGLTYVDDNQALKQTLAVAIQSPVASCGATTTPTCNPQFKIGQSVTFKITFSPPPAFAPIARLSIAKVHVAADGTIQIDQTINVFSKNNVDVDNFFNCSTSLNQCNYNWDSSGAATAGPGLYQGTIFSDSFVPQIVYVTLKQ
jgi:hypothetical protein